jgi:hypothetical protein
VVQSLPPEVSLWHFATAYYASRCLHVLAEIGVADALDAAPASTEALAEALGADAAALGRLMRVTAAHGVFRKSPDGWVHTPESELLRSDHPRSMRAFVCMTGGDMAWRGAGVLAHSARTGATAIEAIVPGGIWAYFKDNPDKAKLFNASMTAKANAELDGFLSAVDPSGYQVIADIGGGRGHYLAALLGKAPHARGVLYDQPQVVADAPQRDRIELQGGDFFKGPLPKADAYLISNILHDWRDPEAVAILSQVRAAAPDHADILVIENVLSEEPTQEIAQMMDIMMLTVGGGQERTLSEYAALFASANLRLDRVVPTSKTISVIFAKPVLP